MNIEESATATETKPARGGAANLRKRGTRREPTIETFKKVSVAEAARRLGMCKQTVRNMANSGKIKWAWGNGPERPCGIIWQSVEDYINGRNAAKSV